VSTLIAEKDLPQDLTAEQAVEAAYASDLAEVASKLQRGLPVLVECDKDLAPFLYVNLRARLRPAGLRCVYLDGRPRGDEPPNPMAQQGGLIGTMIGQLRDAVRGGAVERRVVVLPHLDLLTTSHTWSRRRRAASSASSSTRGRCTSTSPASTPSGCVSCCPRSKARTIPPTRAASTASCARRR
jgi:hypothetical protein